MRLLLRLLSPLLGLAVAAAGMLVVAEVAWAWGWPDRGPLLVPWRDWLASAGSSTWADTAVRMTAVAVLAAGLMLLTAAFLARRHDLALVDPAPDITVITSRTALARLVGQRVRSTDGVQAATVTASRRCVRVRATGRPAEPPAEQLAGSVPRPLAESVPGSLAESVPGSLAESLADEVRRFVRALPLRRTPRVRVAVRTSEEPS